MLKFIHKTKNYLLWVGKKCTFCTRYFTGILHLHITKLQNNRRKSHQVLYIHISTSI